MYGSLPMPNLHVHDDISGRKLMHKNGTTFHNHISLNEAGFLTKPVFIICCIIVLILPLSGCAEGSSMKSGKAIDDSTVISMEESSNIAVTEQSGKSSAPSHTYTAGTVESSRSDSPTLQENGIVIKKGKNAATIQLQDCKDILLKISSGETEGLPVKKYEGDERIEINGDGITLYRDGDFIYTIINPSGGMQQITGTEAYTLDKGSTWYVNYFEHPTQFGSMYILNKRIVFTDDIKVNKVAAPAISYDYGESFTHVISCSPVSDILMLPGVDNSCYCYREVSHVDREHNLLTVHWYMDSISIYSNYDTKAVYAMDVNMDTFDIIKEEDLSGLAKYAAAYAETGFVFPDSSTDLLDPDVVKKHLESEYELSTPEQVVWEIELGINEIYARNGVDFSGTDYEKYFKERNWYNPVAGKNLEEIDLNQVERPNLDFLEALKKHYRSGAKDKD